MKQIITYFFLVCLLSSHWLSAQVKEFNPTFVSPLNLNTSDESRWKKQQELGFAVLKKIYNGTKEEDLTEEEQEALENVEETKEDYWETIGGGCSWYCGGGPKEVTASSYLKSQGANTYEPKNAHDFSYKEAWVEGAAGYGVGEYLLYTFSSPSPRITEIIVVNGYVKSATAYKNNSRVKKLKVYLNDKPYAIFNLKDTRSAQYFKVGPLPTKERQNYEEYKDKPDWTLKFEIMEVYKGDKYDDTVISEIYFDGVDVHCFAAGTKVLMADKTEKNIEDVKKGDVIFYPVDYALKIAPIVKKIEAVEHDNLVRYVFESGATITATQDHPFMVKDKGWCSLQPEQSKQYKAFDDVQLIKIGQLFKTVDGTDKLIDIHYLEGKQMTYTLSKVVGGCDKFVVNGFIVGIE